MSINLFCPRSRRVDSLSRPPGFGHISATLSKNPPFIYVANATVSLRLSSRLGSDCPPDCHSFTRRRHATFSKEGFKLPRHPFKLFRTAKNTHTFRHACFLLSFYNLFCHFNKLVGRKSAVYLQKLEMQSALHPCNGFDIVNLHLRRTVAEHQFA